MKIALLEPFFTGSHQSWAEGYQQHSQHDVEIFSLPGRHWKWRMHGGAVALAQQFMKSSFLPDLILATDMLDLSVFMALTKKKSPSIPVAIYFHENQLTYPWSATDPDVKLKRDNHYAFINYTSALAADHIFFNSQYHLDSFINGISPFLKQFPDHQNLEQVDVLKNKSQVLALGIDLKKLEATREIKRTDEATILWNHRWEYDKKPGVFFESLFQLKEEGVPFKLIVLGQSFRQMPAIFETARKRLFDSIIHFGYTEKTTDYAHYLWQSDILPVTGIQDFFGGSVVEAMYCGCYPILPNRLAYPEHIPTHLHADYFYEKDSDFYNLFRSKIINITEVRSTDSLQKHVAHYDWKQQATLYDEKFKKL